MSVGSPFTGAPAGVPQATPARSAARQRTPPGWGPAAALAVALVAGWEAMIRIASVPEYLLPAPSSIVRAGIDDRGLLAGAAWVTTKEVVLGTLLAVAVALVIALVLHASQVLRRIIYPLLIASQTVPVVVFAPVLAILFGYGIEPKLVIVALICFFPVVVNTLDGLRSVDPELPRLMYTLHAGRWAIFRRVEFPSALPRLFSGVRIAVTYAPIGAVFGEWSGSTDGLGFVMLQATPQLRTALVFAAIVCSPPSRSRCSSSSTCWNGSCSAGTGGEANGRRETGSVLGLRGVGHRAVVDRLWWWRRVVPGATR